MAVAISEVTNVNSDPLIDTPLEGISLEQILQNVDDNTMWMQDEVARARIKHDVEQTYLDYLKVMSTTKTLYALSQDDSIDSSTADRWRKQRKKAPRMLRPYLKAHLPKTEEDFLEFAYLLGTVAYAGKRKRSDKSYTRTFHRKETVDGVVQLLERFGAQVVSTGFVRKKVKSDGKQKLIPLKDYEGRVVKSTHSNFMKSLVHSLTQQNDKYIRTDRERAAFLRGYFDTAKFKLVEQGNDKRYTISISDPTTFNLVLTSLFELGIYPSLQGENEDIVIQTPENLTRLVMYDIVTDEEEKETIASLTPKNATGEDNEDGVLRKYNQLRNIVKHHEKEGVNYTLKALAQELGISAGEAGTWTRDQRIENDTKNETPKRVTAYRKILKRLSLADIYSADKPVRRNGKIFFNIESNIFILPYETQQDYLEEFTQAGQLSQIEIELIESGLRAHCNGRKAEGIEINKNVITGIVNEATGFEHVEMGSSCEWYERNLLLCVDSTIYVFTPKAQRRYFTMYGLPIEEIDREHIDHLSQLITHHVNKSKKADVKFTTKGNNKVRIVKGMRIVRDGHASWDENNVRTSLGSTRGYEDTLVYHKW